MNESTDVFDMSHDRIRAFPLGSGEILRFSGAFGRAKMDTKSQQYS